MKKNQLMHDIHNALLADFESERSDVRVLDLMDTRKSASVQKLPKRILYVDDDPLARKAFQRRFIGMDYIVTTVDSGLKALKIFLDHRFDAVVLDVSMPEMDGFAVLEQLKKIDSRLPVMMMSGVSESYGERAQRKGCDGFFPKSCETKELDQCLLAKWK